jgi:hypothetical protein
VREVRGALRDLRRRIGLLREEEERMCALLIGYARVSDQQALI